MATPQEIRRLQALALEARRKLMHLCGTYEGVVHIGGDLSMADLLIGLYHHGLNVNPNDIQDPKRDRFILSKGHGAVGMYISMALRGFFDYEDIVKTYGKLDSSFGMHVCKVYLKGAECSTGSLGHGLAVATGMAFVARQRKETHRVFCMMGDGETCEGSVWEAANTAGSYKTLATCRYHRPEFQMMTSFDGDAITLVPLRGQMEGLQLERRRKRRP
jgi:transketolase